MPAPEPPSSDTPVELSELARREGAWLQGLARRLVGDTHDADDVLQETWLRVLRVSPTESVAKKPWLARVLNNVALNRWRGERRRLRRESRWELGQAARPQHTAPPLSSEAELALRGALNRLSEKHRILVVLRHLEGLPPAEIADLLGIPGATVRSRLKRALDRLKDDPQLKRGVGRRWLSSLLAWLPFRGQDRGAVPRVARRVHVAGGAVLVGGLAMMAAIQLPSGDEVLALPLLPAREARELPGGDFAALSPLGAEHEPAPLRPTVASRAGRPALRSEVSPVAGLDPDALALRVIDEQTGLDLEQVSVYALDESSSEVFHPGGSGSPPRIGLGASPLRLGAEALDEAWQLPSLRRRLLVGAPGYAWARVTIAPDPGGRRQVSLNPEAQLSVQLQGSIPDTGVDLLVVRESTRFVIYRRSVSAHDLGKTLLIDGLAATGMHRVVLQATDVMLDDVLAESTLELEQGVRAECSFFVDDFAVPPMAAVWGSVITPAGLEIEPTVRLLARREARSRVAKREFIAELGEPQSDGSLERREWSLEKIPEGEYVAMLEPFGLMKGIEIVAGETSPVELALFEVAELEVRVRDADSGAVIEPTYLEWQARHHGLRKRTEMTRATSTPEPGVYRVLTAPGEILLESAWLPEHAGVRALLGELTLNAKPGFQRVDLLARDVSALRLSLSHDGFEVSYLWPANLDLETLIPDAGINLRSLGQHGVLFFEKLGEYVLTVGAPPGYEPLEPIEVRLHSGMNVLQLALTPR